MQLSKLNKALKKLMVYSTKQQFSTYPFQHHYQLKHDLIHHFLIFCNTLVVQLELKISQN